MTQRTRPFLSPMERRGAPIPLCSRRARNVWLCLQSSSVPTCSSGRGAGYTRARSPRCSDTPPSATDRTRAAAINGRSMPPVERSPHMVQAGASSWIGAAEQARASIQAVRTRIPFLPGTITWLPPGGMDATILCLPSRRPVRRARPGRYCLKKWRIAMRRFGLFIGPVVIGVALVWLCNAFGLWWATLILGCLLGLLLHGKDAFGAAVLIGGLGWGLPLLLQALHAAVGQVAATVAILVGLGSAGGPLILLLTILLGVLLCVVGTWLGVALRGLVTPQRWQVPDNSSIGL